MVPEGIDDLPIIQKGHDPEVCFRIIPVKCHSTECFSWDSVEACESAKISLDEFDVDGFLGYFFRKHFDKTLIYNQQRHDDVHGIKDLCLPAEFEWYLTHNFYSYDAMRAMLDDIRRVMDDMRCGGLDAVPPELSKDIKGLITESCGIPPSSVTYGDSFPPGGSLSALSLPLEGKVPRRGG